MHERASASPPALPKRAQWPPRCRKSTYVHRLLPGFEGLLHCRKRIRVGVLLYLLHDRLPLLFVGLSLRDVYILNQTALKQRFTLLFCLMGYDLWRIFKPFLTASVLPMSA
ncbi:MAG: hypothetical protein LBG92_00500 [Prevotellaceae bacterium]|nr:hypothetical protein [Prevotellaceae bacterium]